jgi:hypothetical protein
MTEKYRPWYENVVDCDFCGQPTHGRVYEDTRKVVCGSCQKTIIDDIEEKWPDWG